MTTAVLTADMRFPGLRRLRTVDWRRLAGPAVPLAVCLAWAYWPTLVGMAERWLNDPQYTHGWLVPAFAGYLLWSRREGTAPAPAPARQRVWGLALLLVGIALRLAGAVLFLPWLDAISLLPSLAGLAVLLGGWAALRWAWPAVAFLAFMPPLPYRLQLALGGPLQQIATRASTYLLQTVGVPATAEGNVIILSTTRLGVVEACSGLSMLVTFFALAAAVALLVRRPWPDKLLIVASAVPIAVASNVARITVTAVLFETAHDRAAHLVFHDLAGWLMMPVALAMLGAELAVLDRLLVAPPVADALPISPVGPGAAPVAGDRRGREAAPVRDTKRSRRPRPHRAAAVWPAARSTP
jgi:exosortase